MQVSEEPPYGFHGGWAFAYLRQHAGLSRAPAHLHPNLGRGTGPGGGHGGRAREEAQGQAWGT